MNYQKIDAALALALNQVQDTEEPNLSVFIHVQLDVDHAAVIAFLENLGVRDVTGDKNIYCVALSPDGICLLSEQPWVQHVKLSQQFRLLSN